MSRWFHLVLIPGEEFRKHPATWRVGMTKIWIFIIAILLNAMANITMKIGMNRVGGLSSGGDFISKFLLNWVVWLGIFFFGLALAAYSVVLSSFKLSVAYPIMTSAGFLVVFLVSALFLNERINLAQCGGMLLIMAGIWLVSQ
jgi:multidrug transporter EmrE-like cation transporter